jgi:hypothetical protein
VLGDYVRLLGQFHLLEHVPVFVPLIFPVLCSRLSPFEA